MFGQDYGIAQEKTIKSYSSSAAVPPFRDYYSAIEEVDRLGLLPEM